MQIIELVEELAKVDGHLKCSRELFSFINRSLNVFDHQAHVYKIEGDIIEFSVQKIIAQFEYLTE